MKRYYCCVALLLVGLTSSLAAADQNSRPNILFILADDVGQEVLGCYGGESYETPHLDKLAETGMKFRHCYSMSVCHPSRLTLMTGKYPFRHDNTTWGDFPLDEEGHTFANRLRQLGYRTAIAGKWQLTLMREDIQHPVRLGFDQWDLFGWHEGPRYYEPMIYRNAHVREDTLGFYGPDLYVRSLIEFMKENRDRPFCAYYSMALCHDVTDDLEEPVPHGPFDRYDSYAEMVDEMDRNVGRLVAALNALDLREKTLIFFVADNGSPPRMILRAEGDMLVKVPVISRQNGRYVPGGKGTMLDTGTRVPCIANWPGTIESGQVTDALIDFSDILPTFVDLAGGEPTAEITLNGQSFLPLLKGETDQARRWVFMQQVALPKPGGVEPERKVYGEFWVRTQEWKLYFDGRLYHMAEDPREKHPILKEDDTEESKRAREQLQIAMIELGC